MADGFRINKAYAEKYNAWRQKEELQKLKDRYGGEEDSEDSSSSESEDEDAEALTEVLERDWLRTLSALKSKDPKIYQKDVRFYHDEEESDSKDDDTGKSKKTKDKPMYLKDYERKVLLEKGGVLSDEEGSGSEGPSTSYKSQRSYHHEQEQLRKNIIAAIESDSDESENEGLLKRREKSAQEKQQEDTDYLEWLKGQKDTLDEKKEVGVELEPLKKYWQNKNLDEGERFLKNYILNRQYIDKDDSVPTYDEIVNDEDEDFSEEEELLTKQDTFERKYNFRYEEPDAAEIKTFPRNFEETVRRKDTKRAEKRKEVEERKKREKEKKKEELKQLKKMKRQEILDKIEKLKQITGNKTLGIDEKELEEDFDPNKHDQMMQQCFDDQYYDEGEGEEVKPVFEMSDEEYENWDNWTGDGDYYEGTMECDQGNWNQEPSAEDPDFIMDADYDPVADMERKKKKKEKKKKNKLAQALTTKKPVFDPAEKTFEEYFDEYYKLDYEDIIDDMPCRFKYRKVKPNTYGLSVDEILKCRDKELNAWASVKKMSQYRTETEEEQDIRAYSAKGKNLKKKQNILTSLFESEEKDEVVDKKADKEETGKESKSKKRRRRKKAKKEQMTAGIDSQDSGVVSQTETGEQKRNEGKKGKVGKQVHEIKNSTGSLKKETENTMAALEAEQDRAKHSNKRKAENIFEDTGVTFENGNEGKSKRKKKKGNTEEKVEDNVSSTGNNVEMESSGEDVDKSQKDVSKSEPAQNADSIGKKKKKNRKKKKNKEGQKLKMSEERLKAYGINPKKYKYMKKEEMFQMKPRKDTKQSL